MKITSHYGYALWLVVASCFGSPTPCLADMQVALHGDSELHAMTVRLSDLFSGVPAGNDRDIAQAPLPGKSATYDAHVLERLADKYQLDWKPSGAADHVTLTTSTTHISADDIRDAIVRKIKDSGVRGDIEASFDNRTLDINLPGDQRTEFTFSSFDYDLISKRFRGEVAAGQGASAMTLPVSGRVTIKRQVPTLAHRLENGSIIGMTDIDWVTVPDERVTPNVITSAEQLVGRELRHTVSEGDVIHANDVIPARLVTRGSMITLKIETPTMLLTAQGRALQDGADGDLVRVTNTQSNRTVEGLVTGPGVVSVHVGQKVALAQ